MAVAAFVVSLIALAATIWKSIIDYRIASDSKIFLQLKVSLENAYNSLKVEKNGEEYPIQDRSCWMTAARHIKRYLQMRQKLRTKIYELICDETEEHWKTQFYMLLKKIPNADFYKWKSSRRRNDYENIQPGALAVIISFVQNDEKSLDSLHENTDYKELVDKYKLYNPASTNFFFDEYIKAEHPTIWQKPEIY